MEQNNNPTVAQFSAQVIQYLRPSGKMTLQETSLPIEELSLYFEMVLSGCHFEAEVLNTGAVSVTITHPEHGDIAHSITDNSNNVQHGMVKMLRGRRWREYESNTTQ